MYPNNTNSTSNGCTSNKDASPGDTTEEYSKKYSLYLHNCSFARNPKIPVSLSPNSGRNTSLIDISLAVRRGELVGVVGGMASGKSTLISALSGEIKKTRGSLNIFDKVVYVPNRPWLKSGTIRDNISFGANVSQQSINRSKLYEKVKKTSTKTTFTVFVNNSISLILQQWNFKCHVRLRNFFGAKIHRKSFIFKSNDTYNLNGNKYRWIVSYILLRQTKREKKDKKV